MKSHVWDVAEAIRQYRVLESANPAFGALNLAEFVLDGFRNTANANDHTLRHRIGDKSSSKGTSECPSADCVGTVTFCGVCISEYHLRHILVMSYITLAYDGEVARAGGLHQEGLHPELTDDGAKSEVERTRSEILPGPAQSGGVQARARARVSDLVFNEAAIAYAHVVSGREPLPRQDYSSRAITHGELACQIFRMSLPWVDVKKAFREKRPMSWWMNDAQVSDRARWRFEKRRRRPAGVSEDEFDELAPWSQCSPCRDRRGSVPFYAESTVGSVQDGGTAQRLDLPYLLFFR